MELSVIIPAYNEEVRVEKTLQEIVTYLAGRLSYEIIVVDDGSIDGTYEVCQKFLCLNRCGKILRNVQNRGKGYSVRKGMLEANGELRLFSDADMSTPIDQVEKLIDTIREGYDIAIGSRSIAGSNIELRQPFYREFMGKIFNFLVQTIAVRGIIDTQCGFKLFTEGAARSIFSRQYINRFSFDVEVLFVARKLGYRVKEIPITWINSPASKVNPVTDSIRMLRDLFYVRLKDLKGGYR